MDNGRPQGRGWDDRAHRVGRRAGFLARKPKMYCNNMQIYRILEKLFASTVIRSLALVKIESKTAVHVFRGGARGAFSF